VPLADDLRSEVSTIFTSLWTQRDGQVVPEAGDLKLGNDAVKLEGAVLYADLAASTALVDQQTPVFAAEVYKTYLHCAAKLIRNNHGAVVSYDGDRVMGVFIGGSKRTNAAKCALQINWAVSIVINDELRKFYRSSSYEVRQAVGIDVSNLFIARTGVRGANDLVWVGRSANHAAKLCSVRQGAYASFITADVFDQMNDSSKFGGEPRRLMWEPFKWEEMGVTAYRSSWRWAP
jgi:class 3 adenylate cyclase